MEIFGDGMQENSCLVRWRNVAINLNSMRLAQWRKNWTRTPWVGKNAGAKFQHVARHIYILLRAFV